MRQNEKILSEKFNSAPIAKLFGMRLHYPREAEAVVELPYNLNLDHALGGIHGGVIATLIDIAGWFSSAACHEGSWVATAQLSVNLVEHVEGKPLRAEGRVVRRGKRVDFCEMKCFDSDNRLIATGTGVFVVQPKIKF